MKDGALLQHISHLPHGKANLKHLVRELRVKGADREKLEAALERLVERGELIEVRKDHFTATAKNREFAVGRMSIHRDGYGFLIPDKPIEGISGDIFIPTNETKGAMNGDRAIIRVLRVESGGRSDGEVVKILKRAHPTVVGEFRVGSRGGYYVIPQDERLREWIDIPEDLAIPRGGQLDRIGAKALEVAHANELDRLIVNVELLEYPGQGRREGAIGRVIEILGRPDDFGVEVEIIIRKHHLPHRFPPEVIEQAKSLRGFDLIGRRDFRDMPIVTIDGETARDFDDAVWVDRLGHGGFALHVHIADVSHYVRPGSPIDIEARLRGTSVYFPDRAVPMLPFELSTDVCSLVPQQDRPVVSALMEFDRNGGLLKYEFCRGVIRSAERMTYTSVWQLLEGEPEPRAQARERYSPLVDRFEMMREFALILNAKRVKRGSIDFDLPEPIIEFDEFGAMTGVKRAMRNIAHRIIEEFMLAANEAVAEHLEKSAPAAIFRIHEQPDARRVMEFEEIAKHFGVSLGIQTPVKKFAYTARNRDGSKQRREIAALNEQVEISSRNYQKLVAKIEGRPEERILSYLMLRSLKQARYSVDNAGHFALAAKHYTHFTSPIRRYPDLIVHRLLMGAILEENEIVSIADSSSQTERRAAEAERELVEWKKAKFMVDRVGDEFKALVISTAKYGLFVELEDMFIEGLVPMESLPGDRYMYQDVTRKVVGARTRREFKIGDEVRVALDRVDPAERKLQFSIVEEPKKNMRKRF
jgi:ribonuclease R